MGLVEWSRMTVETTGWKVVLDSRTTITPDQTAPVYEDESCQITASFQGAQRFLVDRHSEKIVYQKPFGGFDFGSWDTWLVLILLSPIIIGMAWALMSVMGMVLDVAWSWVHVFI